MTICDVKGLKTGKGCSSLGNTYWIFFPICLCLSPNVFLASVLQKKISKALFVKLQFCSEIHQSHREKPIIQLSEISNTLLAAAVEIQRSHNFHLFGGVSSSKWNTTLLKGNLRKLEQQGMLLHGILPFCSYFFLHGTFAITITNAHLSESCQREQGNVENHQLNRQIWGK